MKIFCPIKIERPNFLFLFFLHTKFLSKIDESKRVKILIPIYCFDKLLKKEKKKRYDKHLNPTIKYNSPRDEAWPKITFTDFAIYPRDFGFRTIQHTRDNCVQSAPSNSRVHKHRSAEKLERESISSLRYVSQPRRMKGWTG